MECNLNVKYFLQEILIHDEVFSGSYNYILSINLAGKIYKDNYFERL
ncbi:MAG: hypothetical protein ABIY50_05815 [Ignavibacteria bacterium]